MSSSGTLLFSMWSILDNNVSLSTSFFFFFSRLFFPLLPSFGNFLLSSMVVFFLLVLGVSPAPKRLTLPCPAAFRFFSSGILRVSCFFLPFP